MTYSKTSTLFLMLLGPLYIHAGCLTPEEPSEIPTHRMLTKNPFVDAALHQTEILLKSSDSASIATLSALKVKLEEHQQRLRRK